MSLPICLATDAHFRSFLNDLDRIASRDYVVTDDDVVRARLRTVGIQEHTLFFGSGPWDVNRCMSTFHTAASVLTDLSS